MERVRVAGIVKIEEKFALIHRTNVKKKKEYSEYYCFPGGGLEEGETIEEGVIREIEEELGITVEIEKILFEEYYEKFNQREYFFLCKYIEGEFGTGTGPEYNNDPKYIDSGKYTPKLIEKNKIKDILVLPMDIKEKLVKEIESGNI